MKIQNKTEITADLYFDSMSFVNGVISQVNGDHLNSQTPCIDWSVRDVVNHVVGENFWAAELLKGCSMAEVGDQLNGDLVGEDPFGAYANSTKAVIPEVRANPALNQRVELSFGVVTASEYVEQLFLDAVIHGWDIAVATNQATRLPDDLVKQVLPIAYKVVEQFKDYGVFGEQIVVSESANDQARLLAMLGRNPGFGLNSQR